MSRPVDPFGALVAAAVTEALAPLAEELAELRRQVTAPERLPTLLDRRGLARELGVSAASIDRLRADGMPELRVCDSPRFELGAVLGWLRDRGRP